MEISVVATTSFPCPPDNWGAERWIWDLVSALSDRGHKLNLFAVEGSEVPPNGNLYEFPLLENQAHIHYEKDITNKFSDIYDSSEILHDFSLFKTAADYIQKHSHERSIATNFNVSWHYPLVKKNLVLLSERQKYMGLQGLTGFESTDWKDSVGYQGRITDAKVIPIGLDLKRFSPKYKKEDYFLLFSAYDKFKGFDLVLDLAKKHKFNLKIAGVNNKTQAQVEMFDHIKKSAQGYRNISVEGTKTNEERNDLFRNAKAYLFPVMFEQPFAYVVLEALACGTPVVAANWGANPELVKHNITGYLANNMDEFLNYMTKIDSIDPFECYHDIVHRFDVKQSAMRYESLYNRVLSGEWW